MARGRQRGEADTASRILDIAERLVQSRGFNAFSYADIASELAGAASKAIEAGMAADRITVDPGLGFGKSLDGNLVLLRYLAAFRALGFPVAVGASRKAFVRRFSGVADDAPTVDRLPGSLAALARARAAGAAIARVHDVEDSVRFVRMLEAIESPPARRPVEAAAR